MTSPDLVAVAIAGFSVGPMILLLVGHFSPAPVLVTGVAGAAGALWMRGVDIEVPDRRTLLYTSIALGVVIGWLLINARYTGQSVYATRDQATYDLTARWLMNHPTLHIATHPEIFGTPGCSSVNPPPCASNESAGFETVNTAQVNAQGNHLMPAYGAVAGWLFGVQGLFHANLVLGGAALFVFYGLARRVAGAPLALLTMSALAMSMPMIYVSRDTFSEPLTMLLLMGALGLLHRAFNTGRVRDITLAGFVAGCAAMVRIDSYGALLPIILTAVVLAATATANAHKRAILRSLALISGCAFPAALGWLDVTWLSSGYYRDQRADILLEITGATLSAVVGLLALVVFWRRSVRTRLSSERTRRRVSASTISGLVLAFLALLSRPLWQQTHGPVNNPHLAAWQAASHVPIDGTLLYNETALNEIGAYYGWVTVALAIIGYAVLLHAIIQRRDYRLVGIVGTGLTMSALYLWNWNIVADQPWAMRRFLPVVAPVMLLAAAIGLRTVRRAAPRGTVTRKMAQSAVVLSAVAVLGVPTWVTWPVVTTRAQVPQYRQVQALCKAIGSDGAVVEIDAASQRGYGQTLRSYCGVPSIGLPGATRAQLAAMSASAASHRRRLFVMAQNPGRIPLPPGSMTAPFSVVIAQRWPNVIGHPPRTKGTLRTAIYLARSGPRDQLVPVHPR